MPELYSNKMSERFNSLSEKFDCPLRTSKESAKEHMVRVQLAISNSINPESLMLIRKLRNREYVETHALIVFYEHELHLMNEFEASYPGFTKAGFSGQNQLALQGLLETGSNLVKKNIFLSPWEKISAKTVKEIIRFTPKINRIIEIDLASHWLITHEAVEGLIDDITEGNKKGDTFIIHGANGNKELIKKLTLISANNY